MTPSNTRDTNDARSRQKKASFEANEEVQRWLREQAEERVGTKPPFRPTLLADQRDRLWVLSSLERFYEEDLIDDVLHVVKSGKEATVYCCTPGPAAEVERVAAKVYRPRMFRSLKNDTVYRQNRAQLDSDGHEVRNDRRWRAYQKSSRGQSERVEAWITYEFRTQQTLYAAGADVPRPLSQIGNGVLMEFIGEAGEAGEAGEVGEVGEVGEAAPLLREVDIPRGEAQPIFARIMRNIELFLACHCIHGDLSAYNILYRGGGNGGDETGRAGEAAPITIIDFAQAVDPRYNGDVFPLLARDVERVCQHFARYGVRADGPALALDMWQRYQHGDL